jgi:predicted PurR-regulated permease PerM
MTSSQSSRRIWRIRWQTGDVFRAAILVLAVYAAARLLLFAHVFVFVTFLGILFGLAVSSGADRLERLRIPRGLGAPLIVLSFLGILYGFGAWSGPTIQKQYRELRERLPQAFTKIDAWLAQQQGGLIGTVLFPNADTATAAANPSSAPVSQTQAGRVAPIQGHQNDTINIVEGQRSDSLGHLKSLKNSLLNQLSGAKQYVFPVISSTLAALAGVLLVLFLAIYIAADPMLYQRGILALIPREHRSRFRDVLEASGTALRKWLLTQLVAMLVIGLVTTATLFALGVPAALPLGILAGLLEFIPTIGPILSAVPSIAMGLTDSPEKALAVAGAYVLIQFLENHLLIPLLMKEGVDLPPVLTILTQAVMAFVFGFIGLFVAVPILVLTTVFVRMLYVEDELEA